MTRIDIDSPDGLIDTGASTRLAPTLLLMTLSGAAGLGWQLIWTQQFAVSLGHEIVAVLAVLAAFFGGLAIGAWALRGFIERSPRPARWYAGLELLIGFWGLGLALLLPVLTSWIGSLISSEPTLAWHWFVAFVLPLVLLLPATAAMGATLPAVERLVRSAARPQLGALYAANTLGAVLGVLLTVFVAIPAWGLQATVWTLAGINIVCGVLMLVLWRRSQVAAAALPGADATAGHTPVTAGGRASQRAVWLLAATGLLGVGYEVLAVRVLSQVTENTVYSYALLLAVYLLGTAAGAAAYQRLQHRLGEPGGVLSRLIALLVLAILLGGGALRAAASLSALPPQWLGASAIAALAGEALAALAAMALPTLVMGALFSHLCLLARAQGSTLGSALAANTAAAALAAPVVGVCLIPLLGPLWVLLLIVLGYLLLVPAPAWRTWPVPTLAGAAVVSAALAGPLRFADVPEGGRILSYRDGVMAAVSVVQDASGVARLRINNRAQEGSSASGPIEMRLGLLPLTLHADPREALFLGLGTGYTASVAARHPKLRVDVVELLPEVIAAAPLFTPGLAKPYEPWALGPRVVSADARRYVLASRKRYDVIVADLFHPARNGAGSLYTVEHFSAVRERLAPGGLFCQWLALHQMELGTLRSIVAAFLQVYPQGTAVLASNSLDTPVIGLIARPDRPLQDGGQLGRRLADPALADLLGPAGLTDVYAVLGHVVADSASLRAFVDGAAINRDDRPLVVHAAPWDTYAPVTTPRQRLQALLGEWQAQPAAVLSARESSSASRLAAYWQARRGYLELGLSTVPDPDPLVMLDRLQEPLLSLLQASPDFRPAAEPLLAMASAVAEREPERARRLMQSVAALRAPLSPGGVLPSSR